MVWRALIVEDEPDILSALAFSFESEGYEVKTATGGATGLRTAMAFRPDLVLLDLNLPGMDGAELCLRLRALPDIADAVVIVVSARRSDSDIYFGKQIGADGYVTKPFDIDKLIRLAKKKLHHRTPHMVATAR